MSEQDNKFSHNDGVTLKEFFMEKCRLHTIETDRKFDSLEKALDLARTDLERRLQGMNEFREQLKEQAQHFITRVEYNALISKYDAEIKELNKAKDILETKASQTSVTTAQIIAVIGLSISIISMIHGFFK